MVILQAVACVVLCNLAGVIGVASSPTGRSPWYQALEKPSFNPPGWVFGPVWTLLYCMMGLSLFLLVRAGWPAARTAIVFFAVQLLLNAAWTPVFFRYEQIGWALVVLVLLDAAVIATIAAAWTVSRPAAYLLLPYLAWILFATVLNASLWRLNS
jgi:tryptophan-rich sensory protein